MAEESIFRSLGRATKALILISEFEARRLTMEQLRELLQNLVTSDEEKHAVLQSIENDLRATGYHPNTITSLLEGLTGRTRTETRSLGQQVRRLRALEEASGPQAGAGPPQPATGPLGAARPADRPPFGAAPVPAAPPTAPPPPPPPPLGGTAFGRPRTGRTVVFPAAPGAAPGPGLSTAPPGAEIPSLHGTRVGAFAPPANLPRPKVPIADLPPVPAAQPPRPAEPHPKAFFGAGPGRPLNVPDRPKVLLADDDMRIRIVFRLSLERLGLQVTEANDGNDAWKKLQEGSFALAILDMKMPGLHGLEVISKMSDRQINIPVIVCTAYDQLKDEFIVATHPRLRYLVKPVSTDDLEKVARELLGMPAK